MITSNKKIIIPNLTKTIKKVLFDESLVSDIQDYQLDNKKSKFAKQLVKLGFKFHYKSGKNILIDSTRKLVIKAMYLTINLNNLNYNEIYFPKNCVPTLFIKKLSDQDCLVVQPLVDISTKSINEVEDYIWNLDSKKQEFMFGSDIHSGNIGLYKNKPVVFDW